MKKCKKCGDELDGNYCWRCRVMYRLMKLLFIALMVVSFNSHAAWMNYAHDSVVVEYGDRPDTSIEYCLDTGDCTVDNPHNGIYRRYINTTKMTLIKDEKELSWLWGWSIRGIPDSYDWEFDGAGEYKIKLEVQIEYSRINDPRCNASSDCYIVDHNAFTVTLTDTLNVTVLPMVAEYEPPVVPYEPLVCPEQPMYPEPEIMPEVAPKAPPTPPESEYLPVTPPTEPEPSYTTADEPEFVELNSGSLSWLLLLPLIMWRRK